MVDVRPRIEELPISVKAFNHLKIQGVEFVDQVQAEIDKLNPTNRIAEELVEMLGLHQAGMRVAELSCTQCGRKFPDWRNKDDRSPAVGLCFDCRSGRKPVQRICSSCGKTWETRERSQDREKNDELMRAYQLSPATFLLAMCFECRSSFRFADADKPRARIHPPRHRTP